MKNTLTSSSEETIKLGYYINNIGVPDINYKWNKKIHYINAPVSAFGLIIFMMSLGY